MPLLFVVDIVSPQLFNPIMTFRGKLALIIFLVGLLPALTLIVISTYILNSTLSRVASSGMESSLQMADSLVQGSKETIGRMLAEKLRQPRSGKNLMDLEAWRIARELDLAYIVDFDSAIICMPNRWYVAKDLAAFNLPGGGVSGLELNGRYYIIFTAANSKENTPYGGGVLMPPNYSRYGRELSSAISASASLAMYKAFTLKLLAVITILAIVIAMAAGLVLSTLLSRQLVRPLDILGRGARQIGSGDLCHRVKIGGNNEFSHLAESFNSMAVEIARNQEKLLEAQRLAAWREVARRIAHEIKNPLTPINIELYRLLQRLDKADFADSRECLNSLEAIQKQIDILKELAAHFSAFAKEPEIKPVRCLLKPLVEEAVSVFGNETGRSFTIDIPQEFPPLELDPLMMSRVIVNLVKNSIEASQKGLCLTIKAKIDNDQAILEIRDSGPGFPDEKLLQIDKPYVTTKKSGTGLGMVIAKKIVEEHGGRIRFFNDSGAVAQIGLPLPKDRPTE